MPLREAKMVARGSYEAAEEVAGGRRFRRASGGETLSVEAGENERVTAVVSEQRAVASPGRVCRGMIIALQHRSQQFMQKGDLQAEGTLRR